MVLVPATLIIRAPSAIAEPGERGGNRGLQEQEKPLFGDAGPFAGWLQEGCVGGSALAGKVARDL